VLNGLSAEGATLGEQSYAVLRKADELLRAAGSSMQQLVKMNVYIAEFDPYPQFNDATRELFADFTPPTRSVIVAPAVTAPALLRIDFLALRGE
jgi:enamine deaminase RidA (YjgF/YER057c/UK114 family)